MSGLMPYVDVCIANEEDAADVFGICPAGTDVTAGKLSRQGYEQVAKELSARFGCQRVAITLRKSVSASDNEWAGMLYDGADSAFSKTYPIRIVDRVGGGDSFGGGLIYALMSGMGMGDRICCGGLMPQADDRIRLQSDYRCGGQGLRKRQRRPRTAVIAMGVDSYYTRMKDSVASRTSCMPGVMSDQAKGFHGVLRTPFSHPRPAAS